ncbi:uncharacterized protein [Mytilus edulis]|uniref:uncharacterized protein n=1 Tax=Mytilus edulis TaxID=6550 RepID=UPI0039EE8758
MVLLSSLELFILVFGSFLELYSCSCSCNEPFGCLQIHKRDEKTLLSCRTSSLDSSVEFVDPSDATSISLDFVGQALKIGNGFVFQFTCKLFQIPIDKSLMFLVNDRTVDILRFEKMDCYNIKGKCIQSSCSCSLSNKTFQWFHTIYAPMENWIFEVQARYTNTSTGKIVQLSWSRTFQTLEFGTLKFRTETIRPDTKETEWQGYTRATINMPNMGYQKVSEIIYSTFELLHWLILVILIILLFSCFFASGIDFPQENYDEIPDTDEITGQTPYKHPQRVLQGKKRAVPTRRKLR